MSDRPALRRRAGLGFRRAADRYLAVIVLLFASMLTMALVGDSDVGRGVSLAVLALTLLVTFRTSEWRPRSLAIVAMVVASAVFVAVVLAIVGAGQAGRAVAATVGVCLVVAAVAAIVRRLAAHPEISFKTVMGALCIYLYFVLFFAQLFMLVDALTSGPFFAQTDDPQSVDFIYFSMVTLTTVGYGDFTSVVEVGRILAGIEALSGQLYLVSVVALLVGNIGGKLRRPGATADEGGAPPEEPRDR